MPDQILSRSPWECFLPASSASPLLVLGQPTPEVLALHGHFEISTNKEAGPLGAVIRLPGGPSEESEAFQAALSGLSADGSLLWFWRRRRPRFPHVQRSGFPRFASVRTYEMRRRALWPEGVDTAQRITKT